jgi:hypothetical protein
LQESDAKVPVPVAGNQKLYRLCDSWCQRHPLPAGWSSKVHGKLRAITSCLGPGSTNYKKLYRYVGATAR